MADFAKVLAAIDVAGVTDGALELFVGQQARIAEDVVDADSFAIAMVDCARRVGAWQGTATELTAVLLPSPKGWPGRNAVKGRLRRFAPSLAAKGVYVTTARENDRRRRRLIDITTGRDEEQSVQNVQALGSTGMRWTNRTFWPILPALHLLFPLTVRPNR